MLRGLLVFLSLAGVARAHDFWIEPESFQPALNRPLAVRLLVGDGFHRESEKAFEKNATPKLQIVSVNGVKDLLPLGREGKTPFVELTLKKPGHHWIALERSPRTIRLEAAKFNDYLTEEGLEHVLDQRRLAKEDQKPGRERYSRFLKCLLRGAGQGDDGWRKVCEQRLEIIPLDDPHSLRIGSVLRVRVQFEGKPLPEVALAALVRSRDGVERQKLRTSAKGIAELKLDRAGIWLVRLVHMRRCADTTEADWESFWSACTFDIH